MAEQSSESVWNVIATRKSIRNFADEPVEDEKFARCLEAARLAPSWANKQCWHFVVVKGKQAVDDLGLVPAHIKNTQVLVIACGDPEKSGNIDGKPYYLVDVAIAVEHFILEAWEQGLGTVWVGALKEDRVRQKLGIPANIKVVALVPVGYPADKESMRIRVARKIMGSANRKDLKEIVHYDRW